MRTTIFLKTARQQMAPRQQHPYYGTQSDDINYRSGGCVYCNELDHNSALCRHQGAVTCHSCGLQGHKAKHHYANNY